MTNFQNLIAIQVWCLDLTNWFEWFSNFSRVKNSLNSSGGHKYTKTCKIQSLNVISSKDIVTHSWMAGLNHMSMDFGH